MNILVIDFINGYGGAEKYLLLICKYLQSKGVVVKIVVSYKQFYDELIENNLDAHYVSCPSLKKNIWRLHWYINKSVENVLKAVNGFQFQIIINNSERGLFFFDKFRNLNSELDIIHICHTTQMSRIIQNIFSKNINKVICVSEHLKKLLSVKLQGKTTIIPNGFILHSFPNSTCSFVGPPLIIGMACVVAPWKSLETALNALLILSNNGIKIQLNLALIFVRKGRYNDFIRNLIKKMSTHYTIKVVENIKDTHAFFSKCDIVLTTSISKYGGPETFGRTIIEGWDAGCAVISSACGGPLEVIKDGINGLLFKEGDSADLAEKIKQLYYNKNFYELLCLNGKKRSMDYSINVVGKKVMEVISAQA